MVEVRLTLLDKNERLWFIRMMDDLEAYRLKRAQTQAEEAAALVNKQAPATTFEELAAAENAEFDAQVVGHIGAREESPPAEEVSVPTEAQIYDAAREHLRKKNLTPTLALLAKHGLEKVTDSMTPEVKIALYADLKAGVAE